MEDKENSYAENLVFQKKVPSPFGGLAHIHIQE